MDEPRTRADRIRALAAGLAVAAVVAVTYAPTAGFEFINFDDPLYVTAEPRVGHGLTLEAITWAFVGPHAKLWHPLTTLSHLVDVERCGLDAGCHHVTSVVLHAANAALVVVVFAELTGHLAASVALAAFFALHPLRVESVAWISERKDVLSGFLGLLAILGYARFARAPTARHRVGFVAMSVAAMMAKPMLVTLPALFLLLDVWPLGRGIDRARVLEKLPVVAFAIVVAAITYVVQHAGGAVVTLDAIALPARIANAIVSYVRYLDMTIAPRDLAVFYPYVPVTPTQVVGAGALLAGLTVAAMALRRRVPAVAIGWGWYLVTLLPVIGLVQAGSQSHADRFTYLPSLGLGLAMIWPLDRLAARTRHGDLAMIALAVLLGGLGIAGTRRYLPLWQNSGSLFTNALAVTTDNYLAHMNLGEFESRAGRDGEADAHYREALRLRPQYVPALVNVGNRLASQHRYDEAAGHYRRAIARDPSVPEAHNGLGFVLDRSGRPDVALAEFDQTLALAPQFLDARLNRAHCLRGLGRLPEAIDEYLRVVAGDPGSADAWYGLALARIGIGDERGAVMALDDAVRRKPDWPDALEVAAWLRASARDGSVRDPAEAIRLATRARAARGRDTPRALIALATAHLAAGDRPEAREAAARARVVAEGDGDGAGRDEADRLLRVIAGTDGAPPSP